MKNILVASVFAVMSHQAFGNCEAIMARTSDINMALNQLTSRNYILNGTTCAELKDMVDRIVLLSDSIMIGDDFSCPIVIYRENCIKPIPTLYTKAAFHYESISWLNRLYQMMGEKHCQ